MRTLAVAAVATIALMTAGCGGADEAGTPTPSGATSASGAPGTSAPGSPADGGPAAAGPWQDDVAPAAAGEKVGSCAEPASFSLAAKWAAKSISEEAANAVSGLTLKCEIDAKPAGLIGFIRVWGVPEAKSARAALDAYLAGWAPEATAPVYRETKIGTLDGAEVRYEGDLGPQRAFAATGPAGAIVVSWGGLDEEEYASGLPAYQLARSTFTLAG